MQNKMENGKWYISGQGWYKTKITGLIVFIFNYTEVKYLIRFYIVCTWPCKMDSLQRPVV